MAHLMSFRMSSSLTLDQYTDLAFTGMVEAIRARDRAGLRDKLRENNAQNFRTAAGDTLLHLAVRTGDVELVQILLDVGQMDVNVPGQDHRTALHIAVNSNDIDMVSVLLDHNADIDLQDIYSMSPLTLAASRPQCSAELFKHMLRKSGRGIGDRRKERATSDISKKLSVKFSDKFECTPMMLVARVAGQDSVVKMSLLLEHGAEITMKDRDGRNVLHHVMEQRESLEVLNRLLEDPRSGRIINAGDNNGCLPLHYAAKSGFIDSLKCLLEAGADRKRSDDNNQTALHMASRHGHLDVAEVLLMVDDAQDRKTLVKAEDSLGRQALHEAAAHGHHRIVRLLLNSQAAITETMDGSSPLHLAVKSGSLKTVMTLLEVHRESLHWTDVNGDTPLHVAARKNHDHLIDALLYEGNRPEEGAAMRENNKGQNALDVAIEADAQEAAIAMAKHKLWRKVLKHPEDASHSGNMPQLYNIVKTIPDAAVEFMDRMVDKEGEVVNPYDVTDKRKAWTYDFSYLNSRDPKSSPLKAMIDHGRWQCLQHGLVEKIIERKWNAFGMKIFLAGLLMHIVYVLLITVLTLREDDLVNGFRHVHDQSAENGTSIQTRGVCQGKVARSSDCALPYIVLVFSVLCLVLEAYKVYSRRRRYILIRNLMKFTLCVSAFVYALSFPVPVVMGRDESSRVVVGAVAVLFGWLIFVLFLRRIAIIGLYVYMMSAIFKTLVKVLTVFMLYLIAFSFAFYHLMGKSGVEGFSNFGRTFVTTVGMMIGELELNESFISKMVVYKPEWSRTVVLLVLMLFVLLMNIVVMNLLVALAVDDTHTIDQEASLEQRIQQVFNVKKTRIKADRRGGGMTRSGLLDQDAKRLSRV
ncbi:PREDICTED: transient receptor potential cation channel subfamily A member 1-like isoform X3 [Branchiostoma belcheri]|uniref:Transient receptor potential cation channel subfamily A member 1-like isoform X3 n=1 Tax=Branchiostoma belcheri TaxID=7741 RepID=A0A6P4YKT1_BRABE|nr:PREDICTED: transient receptor potential cation channel subfamily A member 1-like isoform X3 [Branchiostoma belcheri]